MHEIKYNLLCFKLEVRSGINTTKMHFSTLATCGWSDINLYRKCICLTEQFTGIELDLLLVSTVYFFLRWVSSVFLIVRHLILIHSVWHCGHKKCMSIHGICRITLLQFITAWDSSRELMSIGFRKIRWLVNLIILYCVVYLMWSVFRR
jgi:hypothetical protein